ncbi:MAG: hypothetical protein Q9M92_03940 [Enterobacterales bacterium]|nr:hypothetical protein [Enterobacterales bacterium]
MFDEQLSVELSQKGTLGIADLMTRNILGSSYQTDKIDASLVSTPFLDLNRPTDINQKKESSNTDASIAKVEPVRLLRSLLLRPTRYSFN